jgi:hypothetical protein
VQMEHGDPPSVSSTILLHRLVRRLAVGWGAVAPRPGVIVPFPIVQTRPGASVGRKRAVATSFRTSVWEENSAHCSCWERFYCGRMSRPCRLYQNHALMTGGHQLLNSVDANAQRCRVQPEEEERLVAWMARRGHRPCPNSTTSPVAAVLLLPSSHFLRCLWSRQ